jgi:hypothetical protein
MNSLAAKKCRKSCGIEKSLRTILKHILDVIITINDTDTAKRLYKKTAWVNQSELAFIIIKRPAITGQLKQLLRLLGLFCVFNQDDVGIHLSLYN